MRHHLAVLYRTYVTEIVCGRKTVECRLGQMGYPPHGLVCPGDLVWLKEISGPVRAAVRVQGVRSVRLTGARSVDTLRREWNDRVLAPAEFWRAGRHAPMATLIVLGDVCSFEPFRIRKADRRAWVPLTRPPVPGQSLRSARAIQVRRPAAEIGSTRPSDRPGR